MRKASYFLPLCAAVCLSQCTPYQGDGGGGGSSYLLGYGTQQEERKAGNPNHGGYWDGEGVEGPAKIRIHRAEQKAYFYKGSHLVGVSPVSSGDETHITPSGHFRVTEKDIDHKSSAYGIIRNVQTGKVVNNNADIRKDKPRAGETFVHAPMPNFLRFNHGIGMHTGFLPGYPASHGCVRLPGHMARHFFENAKVGTPVIVE